MSCTYVVAIVADLLSNEQQGGEVAGENGVQAAENAGGDDPLLSCEADNFLLPGSLARGDDGGQLDLRELHGGMGGERGGGEAGKRMEEGRGAGS